MKTEKIRVTANQLAKLMDDLRALPPVPVGDCLSDDEFIGYATETLSAEQVERLDKHLGSCPACATEMERLLQGAEAWSGEQGTQRLAALEARVQAQMAAAEQLASPPAPPPWQGLKAALQDAKESLRALFMHPAPQFAAAPVTESRRIWDWQSREGVLRGHAVLEANGDLTFRFSSGDLSLQDSRFYLRVGSLRREVILRPVSGSEVGAEISIPRHERPSDPTEIVPESD
jgi:hypothetical protein